MNTAFKSNVYPIRRPDNEVPKSRQQIKKESLLETLRKAIRLKHYSKATERVYATWVSSFIDFRIVRHSEVHGAKAIEEFLTYLAVEKKVAASTQNQAFNALLFFYRRVRGKSMRAGRKNPCVFLLCAPGRKCRQSLNNLKGIFGWLWRSFTAVAFAQR